MSPARTLDKGEYEVSGIRTHDTPLVSQIGLPTEPHSHVTLWSTEQRSITNKNKVFE